MGRMGHHADGGFTLIELMLAITVFALVLALGVPAMGNFVAEQRRLAAANELVAALHYTRNEAIRRGRGMSICSRDGDAASPGCEVDFTAGLNWHTGWIVFEDQDGGSDLDAGEPVLRVHERLAEPLRMRSVGSDNFGPLLLFDPDGSLGGAAEASARNGTPPGFDVCDAKQSGELVRSIRLFLTGMMEQSRDVACTF